MLPFFQRELVEKKGWLTAEELLDLNAVAQCTPGVISVNTATYCGYRKGGFRGAAAATLGILTPPILIVLVISAFFWTLAENPWVQHALAGVRAWGGRRRDPPLSLCRFFSGGTVLYGRRDGHGSVPL